MISCVWVIIRGEYILDHIILFYIGRYLEFETGLSACNSTMLKMTTTIAKMMMTRGRGSEPGTEARLSSLRCLHAIPPSTWPPPTDHHQCHHLSDIIIFISKHSPGPWESFTPRCMQALIMSEAGHSSDTGETIFDTDGLAPPASHRRKRHPTHPTPEKAT